MDKLQTSMQHGILQSSIGKRIIEYGNYRHSQKINGPLTLNKFIFKNHMFIIELVAVIFSTIANIAFEEDYVSSNCFYIKIIMSIVRSN